MTPKADDIRELVSGYKVSTADAKRVLMLASDKQEAHELAESILDGASLLDLLVKQVADLKSKKASAKSRKLADAAQMIEEIAGCLANHGQYGKDQLESARDVWACQLLIQAGKIREEVK